MTQEQLKEKIEKRIEWLESQKDEITVEYCKDEIPFDMYDICMILELLSVTPLSANSK